VEATSAHRPSVVIVGGGMGGIEAAKALATAAVDITLVSPRNYYLFQPLIYEVANALLQAEDVAHSPDGRIRVQPNLGLPGHPQAFAIGDMAALPLPAGGLHPALAQFAIQGGRHAAREIIRHISGRPSRPFRYWDKGMTASVGRDAGIVQTGHLRFSGRLAFFAWGVLHSLYVPGWRNRLSIDLNWLWSYATHRRAALMLIGDTPPAREQLASRQPSPAVEVPPGFDDAPRGIAASERRTPPAGT
jgi:NADH dehydrogenase FAD-containing subunit